MTRQWAVTAFMGLVSSVLLAVAPTLPEGAYPEWELSKAWQVHSALRSKVCLNGLWQFVSDVRCKPVVIEEVLFEDDLDGEPSKFWDVMQGDKIHIQTSSDSDRKTSGNASMKFTFDVEPSQNFYHVIKTLKGLPRKTKLSIRLDVYCELETGGFWMEIQDLKGWDRYLVKPFSYGGKPGWQHLEGEITIPESTEDLKVIVFRSQGAAGGVHGSIWLDNFRVVKVTRLPFSEMEYPAEDAPWGYGKVPGSWKSTAYLDERDPAVKDRNNLDFGWYRRTVEIPAEWKKRQIKLAFDRVSTDGTVFVNHQKVGTVGYLGGEVDITKAVTPGQKAEIAVFVQYRNFWDVEPILIKKPGNSWQSTAQHKGILGDVFMLSEGTGRVSLANTRVVTTTTDNKLNLISEISAPDGTVLNWTMNVASWPDGGAAREFSGSAVVKDGKLDVSAVCDDVKYWDVNQPNLYTVKLGIFDATGQLDETLPIRFGFRDFVIKGKFLYLNQVKINLQTANIWTRSHNWGTKDAIRHWLKKAQHDGFTYIYLDSQYRPDYYDVERHFLEVCDEIGMLAGITPVSITSIGASNVDNQEYWELWCKYAAHCVCKAINHPSLVMWRMNMNLNCYNQDQNPLFLDGEKGFEPGSRSAQLEYAGLKSNAFVKSLDPTRPTYNHASGRIGEIYSLNNYLGWPELQDLREWLRVWNQRGSKPFLLAEQATPYPGDFQMRDPAVWWSNEPIMTEYGAIILGDKAYELEEDDYVDYPPTIWNAKNKTWTQSYGYFCSYFPPILDLSSSLYYEAMLPAWRTWGLSAGNNAWENTFRRPYKRKPNSPWRVGHPNVPVKTDWAKLQQPGVTADSWVYTDGGGGEIRTYFDLDLPDDKDYYEPTLRGTVYPYLISPLFAYIAGPNNRWYTVEHAFEPGENVAKSIIIFNDTRVEQTFSMTWRCWMSGKDIAQGQSQTSIQPGEQARLQFAFTVPEIKERTEAEIQADVVTTTGRKLVVKPFSLQFLPTFVPANQAYPGWVMLDPAKSCEDCSSMASVRRITADSELPEDTKVLVIGARALDTCRGSRVLGKLEERVRGGLQVLVMPQTAETLTKTFGLRAFTPGIRSLNLRDRRHPFLKGIQDVDVHDWRGQSSYGPLDGPPASLDFNQREKRVWRCSQEGTVASTVMEKPHKGSFHSILDTGFDVRYAALAEIREGLGRMVLCQLDITERTENDPVALRILANIMESLRLNTSSVPLSRRTVDKDVVVFKRGESDRISRDAAKWKQFLTAGGVIVAYGLGQQEAEALSKVVGNRFAAKAAVRWKNLPGDAPLPLVFAGVSPAEIHWRRKVDVMAVENVPSNGWMNPTGVLADIPVGAGRIVWLSACAEDFDVNYRPDMVYSRVATERLLSIVLANLGVESEAGWARCLSETQTTPENWLYTDKRLLRDDPYAQMRW